MADEKLPEDPGLPADFALQQALARKRELKGSYKAKLSLEKLIIEHERKKIHLEGINRKISKIQDELLSIGSTHGQKGVVSSGFVPAPSQVAAPSTQAHAAQSSKTHREFMIKEMLWM